MSNVQLTRIVPKMLGNADSAVAVTFTDRNGKVVSLAFDGRCDFEDEAGLSDRVTYGIYTDCPIINVYGVHKVDARPEAIMRNLRDALNQLDLGDDDE